MPNGAPSVHVSRARLNLDRPPWSLPALIVILAFVKGLLWTQLLPLWYGPDELAHFDYVQELALTGRSPAHGNPREDRADTPAEVICSYTRLGFGASGPFYASPPFVPTLPSCQAPPGEASRLPRYLTNPAGTYTPLYYALALPFWAAAAAQPVEVRIEAVRLFSVLLGALAALASYLAGYWAFLGRRPLAAATAAVFTLQPMLSQQTAIVNNDALLIMLAAAFFWRLIRAVVQPPVLKDLAILGAISGLAYLAKPQGAVLALLIPIALAPHLVERPTRLAALRGTVSGLAAAVGAAALIVVAGLALEHLLHGSSIHATPVGAALHHSYRDYIQLVQAGTYHHLFFLLIQSFWGNFAYLSIPLPAIVYQVIAAVYALAIIGLVVGVSFRILPRWPILVAVASVVVVSTGLLVTEAIIFNELGVLVLQGRTFLMALVPIAIVLTGGISALAPRGIRGLLLAVVCTAALGLQLVSWLTIMEGMFA